VYQGLGKSDLCLNEEATKVNACREKLANDIYGYYGIRVPRLRISRQPLVVIDPDVLCMYQEIVGTHAYHVMSRWVDLSK